MKNKITKLLAVIGLGLALAGTAQATVNGPDTPITAFSTTSTNQVAVLSWAVVSARSGNGGAPAVQSITAGTVTNNMFVQFYKVTAKSTVTFTNSTVTLFVNNTNGFGSAQSDVVIIQHVLNDWYEKRILTSNSDTTNLVLTVAPTQAVAPGDIVWRATSTGVGGVFLAAAPVTNNFNAGGGYLFIGQAGKPLLAEVNSGGAQTGSLYLMSGVYLPPVTVPRPGL